MNKEKVVYDEGFEARANCLDITDCPYDSFDMDTEDCAMYWINGYLDAVDKEVTE